ncbi:hypothetical protein ACIBG8_51390 [Nonomuraea sp. NPDC050556]|uniref:hypothetical protein n=1 Tax=Nonomuraea sp. NPDC050556 TaxID=3364369 RepID=UPI0037B9A957
MTVRRGLFLLVALSIGGAAFELFTERHWQSWQQLLPWAALAALAAGLALPRSVRVVRAIGLVVLLVSAYGVYAHVAANFDAGFLDQRYAGGLPVLTQWWYALTKAIGVAPPLAPGMLAQSAFLLLLTTVRPRLSSGHEPGTGANPAREASGNRSAS